MRLYSVVATAFFLAFIITVSATADSEKNKLAGVISSDKAFIRSSFTRQNDGKGDRILRVAKTDSDENEARGINLKFWFWKKIGKTPGSVYEKFFTSKNMNADEIIASPKYQIWQDFKEWFYKPKKVTA